MSILSMTLLPIPEAPMTVMVSPRQDVEVQVRVDDLRAERLVHAVEADERLAGTARGVGSARPVAHVSSDSAEQARNRYASRSAGLRRAAQAHLDGAAARARCRGGARRPGATCAPEAGRQRRPSRRRSRRAARRRRRARGAGGRRGARASPSTRAPLDGDARRGVRLPAGLEALEVARRPARARRPSRGRASASKRAVGVAGRPASAHASAKRSRRASSGSLATSTPGGGVVPAEADERVPRRARARRRPRSPPGPRAEPAPARAVERDDDGGLAEARREPPGDDPDDARVPPLLAEDDAGQRARAPGPRASRAPRRATARSTSLRRVQSVLDLGGEPPRLGVARREQEREREVGLGRGGRAR